jgi:DNA repair protein SbcC/Rad50
VRHSGGIYEEEEGGLIVKPLRLSMKAFGPYSREEMIDFGRLGERMFFLICGPTGSGKTTILDAMCFALYGETTSGNDRDARKMRSDFVDSSQLTEITFDFALRGSVYRVHRSPEQEVTRKRGGTGTTKTPAKAALYSLEKDADGKSIQRLETSGYNDVNRMITTMLGFQSSQFRQVVVLPQGEFRRLLVASSKDREDILETLFCTELFKELEDYLKITARKIEESLMAVKTEQDLLLNQAQAESPVKLHEGIKEERGKLEILRQEEEKAKKALKESQEKLNSGRKDAERLDEQRKALDALVGLEKRIDEIAQVKCVLERGKQAAALADAEKQVQSLKAGSALKDGQVKNLEAQFQGAQKEREKSEKKLRAEEEREEEREKAAQEVSRLGNLKELVKALQTAREDAQRSAKNYGAFLAELEQSRETLKSVEEHLEETQRSSEELLSKSLQIPLLTVELREANDRLKRSRKITGLELKLIDSRKALRKEEQECAGAEERTKTARESLASLQDSWSAGQAFILARSLKKGEPCPVCGSREHPVPCLKSYDDSESPPDLLAVKKLQAHVDALILEEQDKKTEVMKIRHDIKGLEEQIGELRKELGDLPSVDPAALEKEAAHIKSGLTEANNAQETHKKNEELVISLRAQRETQKKNLVMLEERFREAEKEREQKGAVLNERESMVPPGLKTLELLQSAIRQAIKIRDDLDASLKKAEEAHQKAREEFVRLESSLQAASQDLDSLKTRLVQEEALFLERICGAGFKDLDSYHGAMMEKRDITQLEKAVREFDEELHSSRSHANKAKLAASGLAEPDIKALENQCEDNEQVYDGLIAARSSLLQDIAGKEKLLERIEEITRTIRSDEEKYAIIGHLSEVANGRNELNLSFHRFVLASLLDDVLIAANTRLSTMSRKRYSLVRRDDPLNRRSAGGLDMDVNDAYTGVSRHVTTLSGGETFLTSLSLALGLADVVQNFSGGMCLDTIFVDEGFGTLDPESLDLAIQTLVDLQQGGRLVGIISHVPELRERIDARLEILSTDRGSTTRFIFGSG